MRKLSLVLLLSSVAVCSRAAQNPPVDQSVMQPYEAHAVAVTGKVSRVQDKEPWAVSAGERVSVAQVISTGNDGYARFTVAGGANFDIFSNSRIAFRQNTASAGDLLDVIAGRVRVHLQPTMSQPQQRIFTPCAVIGANRAATVALAIDEDDTLRIDVLEGEIKVQHKKLPKTEATLVRAVDAIVVRPDEPVSRRVDRGSLYRYTVRSLHDIWSAITPGRSGSHNGDVIEGNKVLAASFPSHLIAEW